MLSWCPPRGLDIRPARPFTHTAADGEAQRAARQQPAMPCTPAGPQVDAVAGEPATPRPALKRTQSSTTMRCPCRSAAGVPDAARRWPAAELARRHEAEHAIGADDLQRVGDVLRMDRAVGAQREHDEVRQRPRAPPRGEQPQALGNLAAAARVDLEAGRGDLAHGAEQHGVADRRAAPGPPPPCVARSRVLRRAAGILRGGLRRERQHRARARPSWRSSACARR